MIKKAAAALLLLQKHVQINRLFRQKATRVVLANQQNLSVAAVDLGHRLPRTIRPAVLQQLSRAETGLCGPAYPQSSLVIWAF